MNKVLVENVRRRVCSVMEEIGGVCTRLREMDDEIPCNEQDQWDDVVSWLTGAAEELREAALVVEMKRDAAADAENLEESDAE
jgi:hypothetical protein